MTLKPPDAAQPHWLATPLDAHAGPNHRTLNRPPPPVITISGSTETLAVADCHECSGARPDNRSPSDNLRDACVSDNCATVTENCRLPLSRLANCAKPQKPVALAGAKVPAPARTNICAANGEQLQLQLSADAVLGTDAGAEPQVLKDHASSLDNANASLNLNSNSKSNSNSNANANANANSKAGVIVNANAISNSNCNSSRTNEQESVALLDANSDSNANAIRSAASNAVDKPIAAKTNDCACAPPQQQLPQTQAAPNAGLGAGPDPVADPQANGSLREQIISFFQATDNKLALKLFGNQKAVMREKLRQRQTRAFVIHPCSNFRFYWDLVMLILLVANVIILPVTIAFCSEGLFDAEWLIFNMISDTIFLLDIGINFRTGIILKDHSDEIVLDPVVIAKHYVRTWFFLDLLSSVPIDYVFLIMTKFGDRDEILQVVQVGRGLRVLRLAKLLSLLKLLRLTRLVRYVTQWEEFLNSAGVFLRIFNLILLILLLAHWNACLQFLVPMLRDFPPDCWVVLEEVQEKPFVEQYTWAVFKTMSHMLCIGYGRSVPQSAADVWLTMLSMLAGAICYAMFIGHATALVQSFGTSKRLYREKFKQLEEYMCFKKLPLPLRQRIISYYEHRYRGKMFNEEDILIELSENLRDQVINYNCRALVAAVPFFTNADPEFVTEVVTKLRFEVFQPGDLIIREGTMGLSMYFLQEGVVDIISKEGEIITSLPEGSYFGEICLLSNTRRTASVRAITYCNVYSLDREHFLCVLDKYPVMRRTMESVAAQRLTTLGKDPNIVSSRADLQEDLREMQDIVRAATPYETESSESDLESSTTWSGTETDGSGLHIEVRKISRFDTHTHLQPPTRKKKRSRDRARRDRDKDRDGDRDHHRSGHHDHHRKALSRTSSRNIDDDDQKDSTHPIPITKTLMASFSNLLKVRSNSNLVKIEAEEATKMEKNGSSDKTGSSRTNEGKKLPSRHRPAAARTSFLGLPIVSHGGLKRSQRSQSTVDVSQLAKPIKPEEPAKGAS